MLALLAFACFPVLAQAEETVYETESTTLPGDTVKSPTHHKNPHPSESSPPANASGSPEGRGSETSSPEQSESQTGPSSGSNPSSPGGGGQGQGGEGNAAGNAANKPAPKVQTAKPVANSTEADNGSSSPLVPILIAVAVLAAISIGAVLVRQRRGSGGSFSPKAS